jgi:spore coat polysaccharide biosynthesis protein SpsF
MAEVTCITQARMTSTRLPGKILMPVMGRPLLEYHIRRLQQVGEIDNLIVATTINADDDPVVTLCDELGVTIYRGPEHDVLSRFLGAGEMVDSEVIVRVTADCPLIDPRLVGQLIDFYTSNSDVDYSALDRGIICSGLDCEIFTFEMVKQADAMAVSDHQREHVTPYFYQNTDSFRQQLLQVPTEPFTQYHWSVDTPEDFELVGKMIGQIAANKGVAATDKGPIDFDYHDCLAVMKNNPEWALINPR